MLFTFLDKLSICFVTNNFKWISFLNCWLRFRSFSQGPGVRPLLVSYSNPDFAISLVFTVMPAWSSDPYCFSMEKVIPYPEYREGAVLKQFDYFQHFSVDYSDVYVLNLRYLFLWIRLHTRAIFNWIVFII